MNTLEATVSAIQNEQNLTIVSFVFGAYTLKMMSLELEPSIQVGTKVLLTAKSTTLGLAKNFTGSLSYSNILKATISDIQNGVLLSSVMLSCEGVRLESIITKESAQRMTLAIDENILVLIKASDLSILKVL